MDGATRIVKPSVTWRVAVSVGYARVPRALGRRRGRRGRLYSAVVTPERWPMLMVAWHTQQRGRFNTNGLINTTEAVALAWPVGAFDVGNRGHSSKSNGRVRRAHRSLPRRVAAIGGGGGRWLTHRVRGGGTRIRESSLAPERARGGRCLCGWIARVLEDREGRRLLEEGHYTLKR